jgi:hypothetical protein
MQDMRLEWAINKDEDLDNIEEDLSLLDLTIRMLDVPQDYHNLRDGLIKAMLYCLRERESINEA